MSGVIPTRKREERQTAKTASKTKVDRLELGRPGTQVFNGFIAEDFNPEFRGLNAIRIFDKMRKTDGTIAAVLKALKLPIRSAEYNIEPADPDNAKEVEIADFCKDVLFERLEGGFDSFIREALGMLDFGFYYFEKLWEVRDGRIVLRKLAPRQPSAHYRWETDDGQPGVTQQLPTTDVRDGMVNATPSIPIEKLVIFTNEKEGDNWEGISVLRSCYKHWFHKDTLYRIDGIRHERGAGVLVITLPEGHSDDDKSDAEELGERFKSSEQSFIVKPHDGWNIEMLTNGIKEQSTALVESIRHHDRMITMSILAQFLDLGAGSTGSRALSEDHSSFFQLSLQAIADNLAETITEYVVKDLVRKNFGERESYPYFKFQRIGEFDEKQTADWLNVLSTAGLISKDDEMKEWVHREFRLPEYTPGEEGDDEEGEDPDEQEDDEPEEPLDPEDELDEDGEPVKQGELYDENVQLAKRRRRARTFAEERVDLDDIERFFNGAEAEVREALQGASATQKKKLLDEAERIIRSRDVGAVEAITANTDLSTHAAVHESAKRALEAGKSSAAKELSVSIPTTSGIAKKVLKAKISQFITRRDASLTEGVKVRLLSIMDKDVGVASALFDLEKIIDRNIRRGTDQLTGTIVIDTFNEGRDFTFQDAREQLHGLQRSELLDDRTCAMCLSLDGRIIKATDPFGKMKQVHDNCRGMWVGILKTDEEKPEPKGIPKSIQSRFDTVGGVPVANDFTQPKNPIFRKDSAVARKIKDGVLDIEVPKKVDKVVSQISVGNLVTQGGHPIGDFSTAGITGPTRDRVDGIKDAMKRGKKMPPIDVVKQKDGTYRIVDGHHRAWAANEEGKKRIDAKIVKDES